MTASHITYSAAQAQHAKSFNQIAATVAAVDYKPAERGVRVGYSPIRRLQRRRRVSRAFAI